MLAKRNIARLLLGGGIILASRCIGQVANAADFTLTSSAFKDGERIPLKY